MKPRRNLLGLAVMSAALLAATQASFAHFLWITIDPQKGSNVHAFLNETPEPGGPEFIKFVKGLKLTSEGKPLPSTLGEETLDARWVGPLPPKIDAESDLGVKSREGKSYRLRYTARAQTAVAAPDDKEAGDGLRVRVVTKDGKTSAQVLFDGKPVAKARIKTYPDGGEAKESNADDQGLATVEGLADGKTALWANWTEPKAGESNGKAYSETRHYATLTFHPAAKASSSASASTDMTFARMPEPAVNSFGGAVLGDWLYLYSGHAGKTHQYSVDTTSKHFRRLNLKDRKTWEELPMDGDVQGAALVSDGKALYRVGGMAAKNKPDEEHDLFSVADFARFDPSTKTWTKLAPMPKPRSTHDAVVIGQTVYVVGGWCMKGETEKSEFLKDALAFDLSKPEAGWKTLAQPFSRRALSAGEVGGKLYVLGGLTDGGKVERRVDVYDPAKGTWTVGPDLPGNIRNDGFGTSAFAVDGALYHSGVAGRVFKLDPAGTAWEVVGALSIPRITHRLLPGPGHTLLAVGGNSKGKQIPVIEAFPLVAPSESPASGD